MTAIGHGSDAAGRGRPCRVADRSDRASSERRRRSDRLRPMTQQNLVSGSSTSWPFTSRLRSPARSTREATMRPPSASAGSTHAEGGEGSLVTLPQRGMDEAKRQPVAHCFVHGPVHRLQTESICRRPRPAGISIAPTAFPARPPRAPMTTVARPRSVAATCGPALGRIFRPGCTAPDCGDGQVRPGQKRARAVAHVGHGGGDLELPSTWTPRST